MSRFRGSGAQKTDARSEARHAFFASMPEWDAIEDIDLEQVPVVEDVVFTLERDAVHLDSTRLGRLCTLHSWTDPLDRILRRGERRPPKGSRENPFKEHEPGWELAVFFENGEVVVLEGPGTGLYDTIFKMPEPQFRERWAELFKEAAEA